MPPWLSAAFLIAVPCFLALVAYDAVAVFLLHRGAYPTVPMHDLARGVLQDFGLTTVYAVTVTPRVLPVVAPFSAKIRRACLIMLGLGIACYDVICASATRLLGMPPGVAVSVVVLILIPVIVAPWYVRWLATKVSEE